MKRNQSLLITGLISSLFISVPPLKADHNGLHENEESDFLELSLSELISLEVPDVTSVTGKKQSMLDSAAAVYVITNKDLKRSGVTSIPEALRIVPGMQVARLNSNNWAISTRGFNYIFANKLLVLIDGRTVYSPLFSGVNWDVQDTLMEDIDRIEVIRGPGAALWGANAVNGVINVITKHSADTEGNLLTAGFGSEEKAFGAYRHGGQFSDDGFYRVFFKSFERDGFKNADGSDAPDDWKMSRAGLRADWKFGNGADASVISEIYDGTTRPGLTIFNDVSDEIDLIFPSKDQRGGHIIGNYQSIPNDDGSFYKFKGYYDRYENYDYRINEKRDVVDLEFRQHMQPWDHHYFIWGASYRLTHYSFSNARNIVPQANGRTDHLYNAFIQDDIALDTNLNLTLGSRFEHNPFTGFEIQPSARLAWKPKPQRTIWTAVSRAVKTPSLSETRVDTYGITLASNNSLLLNILGNETLKSEEITAFEFGFREQIHDSVRLDIAAFANRYQNILTYAGTTDECTYGSRDPNPPYLCEISGTGITEAPAELINEMKAWSYGFEFTLDWNVNEWWSLHANYSAMRLDADSIESSTPKANEWLIENLSANNTANLRSSMNLPNDWQLDLWVRYIDNLRDQEIPAHTGFDVRIGKTVGDNFELSLTGQNLFKKQRLEFNEIFSGLQESEIEQAWYFQLRLNY